MAVDADSLKLGLGLRLGLVLSCKNIPLAFKIKTVTSLFFF